MPFKRQKSNVSPHYHDTRTLLRKYRDVMWNLEVSDLDLQEEFKAEYGLSTDALFVDNEVNKGGNRQGNVALHRIALVRLRCHQPTRDYAARKTREGKGKLEIIRCVKRFIAREAYRALIAIRNGGNGRGTSGERGARLRELRMNHGITQQQVGEALCVPSSRISEIERGRRDLPELEQRAIQWIHSITDPKQHAQTLDNV